MALKTLEALGPLHGYGIARRIEQISEIKLAINYGTIYPSLLKLEQERLHRVGVESVGQQSQGGVLQADSRRAQTTGE